MKVGRSQPGGEQYLALQSLARKTGQGFEQLAILYALEGFLRRLAASTDRDHFVLKGGVLWPLSTRGAPRAMPISWHFSLPTSRRSLKARSSESPQHRCPTV